MYLSKPIERKELFQLDLKRLLIQFSLNMEQAKLFTIPSCARFKENCTIHTRANRKYFEGNYSKTLFHKDIPTQLDFTIPDGYVLSSPTCQQREKVCDDTGEIERYMMFRFSLFSPDDSNRYVTNHQSRNFLQKLCDYFWLSRGYLNNVQCEQKSFFSINFETLFIKKPDTTKSLILTRDANAIVI